MTMQPPPPEVHWPKGAVFTVGHSTLPIERFISLLKTYGVEWLVDIRTVPRSRYNPQFNSDTLGEPLSAKNIDYALLPSLGGLRRARKESPNTGWRNKSFRGYADCMQTQEFQEGLQTLIRMSRQNRVAIMCAGVHGVPVVEILSETNYRMHTLTPFAHIEGTRITYPPEQSTFL